MTKQAWSRRTRSIGGVRRLFPRTQCLCPALCAPVMRAERVHATTMMHLVPLAAAALSCALYINKGHYDTTVQESDP